MILGKCNGSFPGIFLKGKVMPYLSIEICSSEGKLSKSFIKLKSLCFMILLTENFFSFKASGFGELDFIFIIKAKCS